MRFKHTDETDDRIRRGYDSDEPIADIARELGLTRNAVIGRAYRIGLAHKGTCAGQSARTASALYATRCRWDRYHHQKASLNTRELD